ncbi:hypothetical protein [Alteromonas sp. 14N.309.X.WAT.G.H12]|uniref:hypothetical protein n=1 Tax=Alteromonas sp. 14N.309.X.WAT.G.H12 TaxID=3120824 RepID=UPI002FCFC172
MEKDYGSHRSGWSYAISCLDEYHDEHGPEFISFVEKKFVFGADKGDINNHFEPIKKPWVGVVHCPVNVPVWFNRKNSPESYFETKEFKKALEYCVGLVSLSSPLSDWLANRVNVPVSTLLHPTESCALKFNESILMNDKPLRVVQLGFWLRKLHGIHQLNLDCTDFIKCAVGSSRPHQLKLVNLEKQIFNFQFSKNEVQQVGFLENIQYDELLANSIVYVDFYDTSANNAIIECVVRGTPILCPPLKAIVDYLGADYPLYFNNKEEAEHLLKDRDQLLKGSRYLKESGISNHLTLDTFKSHFKTIDYVG